MAKLFQGYTESETPSAYVSFFNEAMPPIQEHVNIALKTVLPWGFLPDLEQMTQLENDGDLPVETGFSVAEDGSIAVAVKTLMPATSPEMWDWWFGWHGSEDERQVRIGSL